MKKIEETLKSFIFLFYLESELIYIIYIIYTFIIYTIYFIHVFMIYRGCSAVHQIK